MGWSFLGRGSAPFWVPLLPSSPAPQTGEDYGAPRAPGLRFDLWRISIQRLTLSAAAVPPPPGQVQAEAGAAGTSSSSSGIGAGSISESAMASASVVVREWVHTAGGGMPDADYGARLGDEALCEPLGCVGIVASSVSSVLLPPPLLVKLVAMVNAVSSRTIG